MSDELVVVDKPKAPPSLLVTIADRIGVEPRKLLECYKQVCFRSERPITDEQLMALMILTKEYHLNPITKELYAFDDKRGGVIPYVGYDGWVRLCNEHPMYDGCEFAWDGQQQSYTCIMWRKDRSHPTVITEYLAECKRNTDPWNRSPRRMLRNRCFVQAARLAFGFALNDQDDAERIAGLDVQERPASRHRGALQQVLQTTARHFSEPLDPGDDTFPEVNELDVLLQEVYAAADRDEAAEVMARAASILGPDDLAQLNRALEERFNEEEPNG